jgi:hypothetical protein
VMLMMGLCMNCNIVRSLGSERLLGASEPDYYDYFQKCLADQIRGSLQPQLSRNLVRSGDIQYVANVAAAEVKMWQWSGEVEYAKRACQRIEAVVNMWRTLRAEGRPFETRDFFFTMYPLTAAYQGVFEAGLLGSDTMNGFRDFVEEMFRPMERGDHNRAICAATGLALATKLFPELSSAGKWQDYIENVWDDWYSQCDTNENSANYNGIFLTYVFILADLTGKSELLLDPLVRQMYERFRRQVSPGGVIADYGDSYLYASWAYWVSAFERAADMYGDPAFRWVAHRVFEAGSKKSPLTREVHPTRCIQPLYHLSFALDWQNTYLSPRIPDVGGAVLTRRESGKDMSMDKLVLTHSNEDGAPFAMVELNSRGHHSHPEWGAIVYYEVANTPLLYGLGYNNRDPSHSNIVLLAIPDELFPLKVSPFESSEWNEAALPTRALFTPAKDPYESDLRSFTSITFRVESSSPVELIVDNLRLEGPAGEMLLDDFQTNAGWRGGRRIEFVRESTQGEMAMKVMVDPGVTFISRGMNKSFSVNDYTAMKFSWKLSNNDQGWARPFIVRAGTPSKVTDYQVPLRQLYPWVERAEVSSHGEDSYGEIHLSEWFTHDTKLVRQMVLTSEGVLVVRDTIIPGKDAEGYQSGPVWHLWSIEESGCNWFQSKELLAYFSHACDRDFGVQNVELWGGYKPYTVYAKESLRSGQSRSFVTVLIPKIFGISGARLAEGIDIEESTEKALIHIFLPAGRLYVEIGDGGWKVMRNM